MAAPIRKGYTYVSPGANNTMTISPDNTISTGDWMILAVVTYNSPTISSLDGWTELQPLTDAGTLRTALYAKFRTASETSYTVVFSTGGTTSTLSLMWGSGAGPIANWQLGSNMLRASIVPATSYNNVSPGVTTATAHSLMLAISTERTTTTETDLTSISGANRWYFGAQTSALQTTTVAYIDDIAAPSATGDVTFVYPNPQANNGMARQIIIPPAAAAAPVASFTYTVSGFATSFNGLASSDSDGTISSYAWSFGDTTTASGSTVNHTYTGNGTYVVTLTVTDNDGNTATSTQNVIINMISGGFSSKIWNGTSEVAIGNIKVWNGIQEVAISSFGFGASPVSLLNCSWPLFVAHRGGSANWPELTTRAYRESADIWGMQAIEVSVQTSSDGTFWCSHDATTTRVTGQNYTFSSTPDTTLAALTTTAAATDNTSQPREPLVKLADILALYAQKRVIFIEDKTYSHQTALLNIMDANGGPNWFVWKQDGTGTVNATAVARGYRTWGYYFDSSMTTTFPTKQASYTYVGLDYNSSNATLTTAIATAGANRVIAHIIPNVTQRDRLLAMGVKGLMIANVRDCLPKLS